MEFGGGRVVGGGLCRLGRRVLAGCGTRAVADRRFEGVGIRAARLLRTAAGLLRTAAGLLRTAARTLRATARLLRAAARRGCGTCCAALRLAWLLWSVAARSGRGVRTACRATGLLRASLRAAALRAAGTRAALARLRGFVADGGEARAWRVGLRGCGIGCGAGADDLGGGGGAGVGRLGRGARRVRGARSSRVGRVLWLLVVVRVGHALPLASAEL
ncbi:hypothetical protein JK358_00600 [Nocardia sp. 2]|uniref:Uncharacterized protein n=1 Tax=Nocardia acididurans TaxID=2802282 RepID=A0ABS1LX47_9NOCA|nr:hypothetical protein [Nocardia acididurans]MBL1072888.1 hypothetical protein [Nocardia acididurans]